ncbi:MAG: hypothetical protein IIC70_05680 [Acidobacteria bacterium]|nr:hypothetical protein [Acidobacteriota bacterium]
MRVIPANNERCQQFEQGFVDLGAALVDNPKETLYYMFLDDVYQEFEAGNYGEGVGRAIFRSVEILAGAKGAAAGARSASAAIRGSRAAQAAGRGVRATSNFFRDLARSPVDEVAGARPGLPNPSAGSIRNINPTGSGGNCVNCVMATDATLSGNPASALPSNPKPISVLEETFGSTFKPVSGQLQIEAILADAGPGARGVVFGGSGNQVGHVFMGVNQRGTIRFLDAQIGRSASFEGFDSFRFMLLPR